MKSKLMKLLKVLAVTVIAVVLILAVEICVTEINAKKIPHRYASAEKGRSLVLANTEFGTNTHYVIDPEECMADNFAFAMKYGLKGKDGQGYPNPEIIQGIIDYVSK